MNIDVCITATCYPHIVEACVSSFRERVIDKNEDYSFRAVAHVDPIPTKRKQNKIVNIIEKHIPISKLEVNTDISKASYPNAIGWCWRNCETDFGFQLEDDWLIQKDIDVGYCLNFLNYRPRIMGVIFDSADAGKSLLDIQQDEGKSRVPSIHRWIGDFAITKNDFHGPPGIFRRSFLNTVGIIYGCGGTKQFRIVRVYKRYKRFLPEQIRDKKRAVLVGSGGRFVADIGRKMRGQVKNPSGRRRWA